MKYRLNFSYFSIIENLLKLMKKKYKQSNPFFFLFPGFVVKHFDFDRYPIRMVEPIFGRAQQYLSQRRGLHKVPSFKKCGLITTYMARLKENIPTRFPSLPLVQAISIFHCNVSLQRKPLISRATG